MSSLIKLRQFGDQIRMICPAHGNTIDNPLDKIAEYIRHRMEREQQIVQLLKSKGPLNIKEIVSILYARYPANVHAAAEKSVLHHLKKLIKEGNVTEAQEDGRYNLC
jgi:predicted transcriptional regulator YheO